MDIIQNSRLRQLRILLFDQGGISWWIGVVPNFRFKKKLFHSLFVYSPGCHM